MNLFKKTLSLVMAFVMALSCMSIGAFAADAGAAGGQCGPG